MFETAAFSLSTACFAFLLCAFQRWGQQCTKQAEMPKFTELTFYLHGKLLWVSSQYDSAQTPVVAAHERHVLSDRHSPSTGPLLQHLQGESMLWAPKCASQLSWRGNAFPQQPSSSYLFLIAFWTFLKSCFSVLSDAALRIAFRVAG